MPNRFNTAVLYISVWLLVIVYTASEQLADPDLWGRLSIAALYFQNGKFPYQDVFSYTAPHAKWVDHEWLTGFLFYGLFTHFGETGFVAFKYLLLLATFGCLFWLHRRVYRVLPLYAFIGLISLICFYNFGYQAVLRAQALSFFFFVLFIACLESVRLGKNKIYTLGWLPLLLTVWANCHGGFIVGVLLTLIYGVGEAWARRSLKWLALYCGIGVAGCVLVGLLNPYGWDYWRFLLHAWTLNRSHISEWSAIDLNSLRFWPVQVLVAITGILTLIRIGMAFRQKESIKALLTPSYVLLFLSAMCLRGVRFQTFMAYGVIAYCPAILSPAFLKMALPYSFQMLWNRYSKTLYTMVPRLMVLGALTMLCFLHSQRLLFQIPLGDELTQGNSWGHYPIGAIRYLRQSPYSGNLLIRFGHGEFAYWSLFPRFKVSMDGRYEEVYTQEQFMENYWSLQKGRTLQADYAFRLINKSAADFILADIKIPVTPLLLNSQQWELIYEDPWFLIFGRKSSLRHFPAFQAHQALTVERLTIQDFLTSKDLRRFKL